MSIKVSIPTPLRKFTKGNKTVSTEGKNLQNVIESLTNMYPGLKKHLLNEKGELRNFVNIYVNDKDIRYLDNLNTTISNSDEISIIPSIAGGVT